MTYSKRNANGQATMANSEPVVIASDQSTVPVSVSGVSTAANQTTIIGHLDGVEGILTTMDADTGGILTAVQLIDNAISGSEMQVDVVAALPAGTNNIGDVDVLSMPGTGVEDAAETAGGTLLMSGSVRRDTAASSAGTTGDNATINTDSVGALWTRSTGELADDAAFTVGTSRVLPSGYLADDTSTDSVDEGDVGAGRMTLDRRQIVVPQPHNLGGLSIFRSLDLDESEEEVKGTAGAVYGILVTNTATSTRWLKFYNATAANVTVGSTTPVITWGIPGNSSDDISGAALGAMGIQFDTAISVAATTGVADNDTGAPAANDVIVNIFYR